MRHTPRAVLLIGVLITLAAGIYGSSASQVLAPDTAVDPSAPSTRADKLIESYTGIDPRADVLVLVNTSRQRSQRVATVVRTLRSDPEVAELETTSSNGSLRSTNPNELLIVGFLRTNVDPLHRDAAKRLIGEFAKLRYVRLGGRPIANEEVDRTINGDLESAESVALPIVLLLSFVFFRGLVAAVLPLVVGVSAIVITLALLRLLNSVIPISVFAVNVVSGLGLGLALDYALFIVSRFREELASTAAPASAIRATLRTAGRTVRFSALTIVTVLASLLIFPERFFYSLGIGGALVTVVAATIALTLLPAILVLLGPRVNRLAPQRMRRAAEDEAEAGNARWAKIAAAAMKYRFLVGIGAVCLLLLPSGQLFHLRFTSAEADADSLPQTAQAREVEDVLRHDFPLAPSAGSVLVVAQGERYSAVLALRSRLGSLPGVRATEPAVWLGPSAAVIEVQPKASDLSASTQKLVTQIRAVTAKQHVLVSGTTASFVDLKHSISERLPLALTIAVVSTLLLVFIFTGSVLLPVKLVLLNVITFSATLGALTFLFAGNVTGGLLHDGGGRGALDITLPPLLFATVFGLSTDYGVFVLGRIKEASDEGQANNDAIATGLARSGRIVTAAALMFAVATGSFVTSQIAQTQQVGLALAIAVLIDAMIIRAMLVPAAMSLLGRLNWWAPSYLERWRRV